MKNFHLPTDTLRTTLTPFSSRLNDQSINQKDDRIIQIDAVALKWMIKSLMKIFHLPTDTLRITSTPFSSRLNDQSIKEIRLRIARILNWAESEVLFPFLRAAQPTQIQSVSTNILLQDTTFLQPSSIGRASNWTYTRLRIARTLNWAEGEGLWHFPSLLSRFKFGALPRTYDLPSRNDLPTALPQLAEHPIEHTHDWELHEHWIGLRARFLMFFLARLSRFKFGALPRTYDLPIAFLNWPSIQLNIHTTENYANNELN